MAQNLHQILIHAVFHKRTHAATIRPNDQPLLNKCIVNICHNLQCRVSLQMALAIMNICCSFYPHSERYLK